MTHPQTGRRPPTNLGNTYDNLGRDVDALDSYRAALAIDPKSGMALGNKGIGLVGIAPLVGKHYPRVLSEAVEALDAALEDEERVLEIGGASALKHFRARERRSRLKTRTNRCRYTLTPPSVGITHSATGRANRPRCHGLYRSRQRLGQGGQPDPPVSRDRKGEGRLFPHSLAQARKRQDSSGNQNDARRRTSCSLVGRARSSVSSGRTARSSSIAVSEIGGLSERPAAVPELPGERDYIDACRRRRGRCRRRRSRAPPHHAHW
jgi:hypothetical protein